MVMRDCLSSADSLNVPFILTPRYCTLYVCLYTLPLSFDASQTAGMFISLFSKAGAIFLEISRWLVLAHTTTKPRGIPGTNV